MNQASAQFVLLVEDDDAIRDQLRELFEIEGYRVGEAFNGAEALRQLQAGASPDLIVLDLMMPVMDGWSLLAAMRMDQRFAALPVLVASATADMGGPMGVPIIRKPFSAASLLTAVRSQLVPRS